MASRSVVLIALNIRSAHNVGSLFRTADAVGVERLVLVGCTPTPIDRFGRPRADIAKVALGAERRVPWEQAGTFAAARAVLVSQGYHLVALEQSADSIDYREVPASFRRVALVVGNEVVGVPTAALRRCDAVMEIPMLGTKESLNVSVAAGIALYALVAPPRTRSSRALSRPRRTQRPHRSGS